jgi:hypothetical protein
VRAIVFLGTPHRGANLVFLLGNLLSASFSQRKYVTQLQVDSELIRIINDQFRDRAQELELVSFHESTEMRGIGVSGLDDLSANRIQLVVPESSAVIGFSGERSSALNGNHLEIVKYSSKEDNNYIRVAGNISVLQNKILIARSAKSSEKSAA